MEWAVTPILRQWNHPGWGKRLDGSKCRPPCSQVQGLPLHHALRIPIPAGPAQAGGIRQEGQVGAPAHRGVQAPPGLFLSTVPSEKRAWRSSLAAALSLPPLLSKRIVPMPLFRNKIDFTTITENFTVCSSMWCHWRLRLLSESSVRCQHGALRWQLPSWLYWSCHWTLNPYTPVGVSIHRGGHTHSCECVKHRVYSCITMYYLLYYFPHEQQSTCFDPLWRAIQGPAQVMPHFITKPFITKSYAYGSVL